jgi:hypothetical protein
MTKVPHISTHWFKRNSRRGNRRGQCGKGCILCRQKRCQTSNQQHSHDGEDTAQGGGKQNGPVTPQKT